MNADVAMKQELGIVSEHFNETVTKLKGKITPDKQKEFNHKKTGALEVFEQKREIIAALESQNQTAPAVTVAPFLCAQIDWLVVPLQGRLDETERGRLRSLRDIAERLDRRLQLLHPTSQQDFVSNHYWMSQKGQSKDLDLLFKVKAKPPFSSRETLQALEVAEQGLIKRECKVLLDFFNLSPDQFAQVIKATIEKCRAVTSPYLKKAFNAEQPTQVIKCLHEIKQTLEDLFESPRIERWLSTPLETFDGNTPREALLEGLAFPILHLLKRFDEGPHY